MASTNIFDLLNDDAQDQEIQIPVVKKEVKPVAAKPAAAATKATDNKAPRKDGARGGKPREGGDDRGKRARPKHGFFYYYYYLLHSTGRGRNTGAKIILEFRQS